MSTVVSVAPVVLAAPGRGTDLTLRVTAPATGDRLPVVVLSHGFGASRDSYGPLVERWAAQGVAVLQPTHLDAAVLALAPDDPRTPRIWRVRVEDLVRCLDELDAIESQVPSLAGRLDRERIVVAGHSWGATTASMLCGARVLGADGEPGEDMADPRVRAGVLLAVAGVGGADLTPFAAEHFPFMHPDFSGLRTPVLIAAGEHDQSALSTRGPDWWTDAFRLSPGAEALLTVLGAGHSLGGITGPLATPSMAEDESVERVETVGRVTTAYLRRVTGLGGDDWARVTTGALPAGRLDLTPR